MAKSNRATRKELEKVVQEIIQELTFLRQGINAIDNYLGTYVKWKGDTITFNKYLENEFEKMKNKSNDTVKTSKNKGKSGKQDRYKKITKPV